MSERKLNVNWQQIIRGNAAIPVLAIVASLIVGGILVAISNQDVITAAGNITTAPGDFFSTLGYVVGGAYDALFRGSVFNYQQDNLVMMLKPLTETLAFATPITLTGLALAISFRSGLFNIGGTGQIIFGAIFAGWVGINLHLPFFLHLPLAILAGVIGGALFGGLVGLLKATTGANEVIVTIMFNYIAALLLQFSLKTPFLQAPNTVNPISAAVQDTAKYPLLFGANTRLTWGFFVMLAAVVLVWWLMNRSSVGFKFRAIGHNPRAARVAGVNMGLTYVAVLAVSGALAGLAGSTQILGTEQHLTMGVAGSFGIDAITVALLGRSNPWGVLAAGILFGGLRAGAVTMQAEQAVPVDIVTVVQSMIVLFIAAPPLVRALFRIRTKKKGVANEAI